MGKATFDRAAIVSMFAGKVTSEESYKAARASIRQLTTSGQCTQDDADDALDDLRRKMAEASASKSSGKPTLRPTNVTRDEFSALATVDHAAIALASAGVTVRGPSHPFSSGKIGWNASGKANVELSPGKWVKCQVGVNIIVLE